MDIGVPSGRITELLAELKHGSKDAEECLIPLVYSELRRIARRHLRNERPNHTLQTTALVNEAYLRMSGCKDIDWSDRAHFFAIAASLMRRILVDHARSKVAQKRGGRDSPIPLNENLQIASDQSWDSIVAIHQALDRLAEIDSRQARVVELRFFSGLEIDEIAEVLDLSPRTIKRDWQFAQAWLYTQLSSNQNKFLSLSTGK